MKYQALIGWGITLYAIMRLASDAIIIHGLTEGAIPHILSLAVLIVLGLIAGRSLRFDSWLDILPYSLFWVAEIAALDAVYTVPFGGWAIYLDWNLWIGYGLVVIIPLIAPYTRFSRTTPPAIT